MRILDPRHVREAALAEIASDGRAREQLSASDRQHIDMCDRCQGLIEGHGRAARALAAPWEFLAATELSSARGVQPVRGAVSGGQAIGPIHLATPLVLIVAALLVMALVATAIMVGGSRPADSSPMAVIPAATPSPTLTPTPSPSPTPIPTPRPLDTSLWRPFVSPHYGLTVSAPADWSARPATIAWDLIEDQNHLFAPMDLLGARDGSKLFAAYGMVIPDGMSSDEFIEAYRAPNVERDIACFPPPSTWEQVPIDGHLAGLVDVCYYIEAIVVVDRRVYIFSGYSDMATDRELFDLFLSTIRLDPTAAEPFAPTPTASPSPTPSPS
jgi:hypothetical protein